MYEWKTGERGFAGRRLFYFVRKKIQRFYVVEEGPVRVDEVELTLSLQRLLLIVGHDRNDYFNASGKNALFWQYWETIRFDTFLKNNWFWRNLDEQWMCRHVSERTNSEYWPKTVSFRRSLGNSSFCENAELQFKHCRSTSRISIIYESQEIEFIGMCAKSARILDIL